MQLVIKEIMDLSVRKNDTNKKIEKSAKLSFSVDRLLKSSETTEEKSENGTEIIFEKL